MKIITLDEISFDKFANNHKYRNYYQTSAYGRTISKNGYDIHYIGIIDDYNNLLGASLLLYKEVFMNYKIAYAPRGFLFDYLNITNLTDEDARVLKLLSKQLGNTDIEGQVSQIEITENFLDVQIKQAQEEKDKNQKLYQKLGTTIGLVIVILLV